MDGTQFSPALWIQRRSKVLSILKDFAVTSLLDLGCGEGTLLEVLSKDTFTKLAGIDINQSSIYQCSINLKPSYHNKMYQNHMPCHIDLYQGSICDSDPRLKGFQALTCVEVVEHLDPNHFLPSLPNVALGYYYPELFIVTTPNAEFNALFPGLVGFRHWDHRFEWTRSQFQEWANAAAFNFGYKVCFSGVGILPSQRTREIEKYGHCTQIAIFVRNDKQTPVSYHPPPVQSKLTHINTIEYPFFEFDFLADGFESSELLHELKQELTYLSYEIPTKDQNQGEDDDGKIRELGQISFIFEIDRLWSRLRIRQVFKSIETLKHYLLFMSQRTKEIQQVPVMLMQQHLASFVAQTFGEIPMYNNISILDSERRERWEEWTNLALEVNPKLNTPKEYWVVSFEEELDVDDALGLDNMDIGKHDDEDEQLDDYDSMDDYEYEDDGNEVAPRYVFSNDTMGESMDSLGSGW